MVSGKSHALFAIILLLNLVANRAGAAQAQIVPEMTIRTLSLGSISQRPGERIKEYRDFVNYLAQRLSSTAEIKGDVVVALTATQLATFLNEKKVDFYMESPYPTFLINEQTGGKLLLRRWKGSRSEYRSLIFTKRDSGIIRLEDLLGRMIAFEESISTSSYFLPKSFLHRKGFKLTEKSSFQANVSSNEIGYLFAHQDIENVVNWVLL